MTSNSESLWETVKSYRFLFIIIGLIMALPVGAMVYQITPYKIAQDKAWEDNYNTIQLKISHMNCPQLQELRFDLIRSNPLPTDYGQHIDTIRDTYNALSCGNEWYWWEG